MEYQVEIHQGRALVRLTGVLDATLETDESWRELGRAVVDASGLPGTPLYVDFRALDRLSHRGLHDLRRLLRATGRGASMVFVGPGTGAARLAELGGGAELPEFISAPPWESGQDPRSIEEILEHALPEGEEEGDVDAVGPSAADLESFVATQVDTRASAKIEEFVIDLDLERLYLEHQSDSREVGKAESDPTLFFGSNWKPIRSPEPKPAPEVSNTTLWGEPADGTPEHVAEPERVPVLAGDVPAPEETDGFEGAGGPADVATVAESIDAGADLSRTAVEPPFEPEGNLALWTDGPSLDDKKPAGPRTTTEVDPRAEASTAPESDCESAAAAADRAEGRAASFDACSSVETSASFEAQDSAPNTVPHEEPAPNESPVSHESPVPNESRVPSEPRESPAAPRMEPQKSTASTPRTDSRARFGVEAEAAGGARRNGLGRALSELRDQWDLLQHHFDFTEPSLRRLMAIVRGLTERRETITESIGALLSDEREGPRGDRWCATLLTLAAGSAEGLAPDALAARMRLVVLAACCEQRCWRPRLGWCHTELESDVLELERTLSPQSEAVEVAKALELWRGAVAVAAIPTLSGATWRPALGDASRYLDGQPEARSGLARIVRALGDTLPGTWVELSSGECGVVLPRTSRDEATPVQVFFRDGRATAPRRFPDADDVGVMILGPIAAPSLARV